MKIKTIHIENFRSFQDQTFNLNKYSCFVGPNGSGKSTILAALNVFFQEKASSTEVSKLEDEDYYNKNVAKPIRITISFDDLCDAAKIDLDAYVRQNELVVTAEAVFDSAVDYGQVKHYGHRLGFEEFRSFFDAEKTGSKAAELNQIYDQYRQIHPDLPAARSKEDKIAALHTYESEHPDKCVLIKSEDSFYGINSTGKLAKFVQWVFVPAVKDATIEGQESKTTALGKLIARAVRMRTSFDKDLDTLKTETLTKYEELLLKNQSSLTELSESLQKRLKDWAHPNVHLGVEWLSDPNRSVQLQPPVAGIKTGEGEFIGCLARMGHGLQRSYLLALLQELANSEAPDAPTLLLGCEEPELYQHPPQARHLADVLVELATGNNQIIVTTHSPLFVNGNGFENIRLVRRTNPNEGSKVCFLTFDSLCLRIRNSMGDDPNKRIEGLIAKIHQALRPGIAEMFFARVPILVEGYEDVAYITTDLHLSDQWQEFRRLGCHLIPVNGKDKLIQPLAIAKELGLPVFVVYDSDGDITNPDHHLHHERDNKAINALLGATHNVFPADNIFGNNYAVWPTNLTKVVKHDYEPEYDRFTEQIRLNYAQEGGLEKNELFIAEWMTAAYNAGRRSPSLFALCEAMLTYARKENAL